MIGETIIDNSFVIEVMWVQCIHLVPVFWKDISSTLIKIIFSKVVFKVVIDSCFDRRCFERYICAVCNQTRDLHVTAEFCTMGTAFCGNTIVLIQVFNTFQIVVLNINVCGI